MRLLSPVTHRQKTKSAHVPEINPEAGSPLPFRFVAWPGPMSAMAIFSPIDKFQLGWALWCQYGTKKKPTDRKESVNELFV
jgi:hypothetical protein